MTAQELEHLTVKEVYIEPISKKTQIIGNPPGRGADGEPQNRDRRVTADLSAVCNPYCAINVVKKDRGFLYIASPQQGDLRLSGPPLGRGVGCGARTRDGRVRADFRADTLATVPPTPPEIDR
ncbi:hypothetical protein PoB_004976300 [Plakobranchus ocellatus]|uniref:Uncharacterized protein n=1 Tax=Plakobranchus ocellatus TaxID=259542 RepID=A0AAV4BUI2_9GAST|nr:hypothetical protein PoB_004976300 [Plakobranchus ocellatus]